jgi:sortase A
MADTVEEESHAPRHSRDGMSTGDKVRFVLRGVGQTLITLGCIVLLFVVYEVWITNVYSLHKNHEVASKLQQEWNTETDDPLLPLPNGKQPTVEAGTGIANLYLPRLGSDYHFAVVQGTNQADLSKGPGHYAGTAMPGEIGNFAVAGHRVGKGEPFLNIDKLRSGDAVIVETKSYWYVYRVKGHPVGSNPQNSTDADGIPGREIVSPSDGKVLLPVPNHPGTKPTERLMTMTTCHPKFTATQRMIVYSVLQSKVPSTGDAMPARIKALYGEVKS